MTLFNLNLPLKALSPNTVTLGVRVSTNGLDGARFCLYQEAHPAESVPQVGSLSVSKYNQEVQLACLRGHVGRLFLCRCGQRRKDASQTRARSFLPNSPVQTSPPQAGNVDLLSGSSVHGAETGLLSTCYVSGSVLKIMLADDKADKATAWALEFIWNQNNFGKFFERF